MTTQVQSGTSTTEEHATGQDYKAKGHCGAVWNSGNLALYRTDAVRRATTSRNTGNEY